MLIIINFLKKTAFFCLMLMSFPALAQPIKIMAAENFYGDIAKQIGGQQVTVTSILSNPNQDPHLFGLSPKVVKTSKEADLIIYNGIGYDSWMNGMLASLSSHQMVIKAADLLNKQMGDNPHLWYDPQMMPALAKNLTQVLSQKDPGHAQYYQTNLKQFSEKYKRLLDQIKAIKTKYNHLPMIATEPVFNEMAKALGFRIYGEAFQLSIMNDIAPTPSQILNFEQVLRQHSAAILIYNNQVQNPTTERLKKLAETQGIPVLGVTETLPAGKDYMTWINEELTALEKILDRHAPQ